MRRAILIGLGLVALSGCAATERVGPDMTWGLFEDSRDGAKLVLGVPETVNVRVMMTCRPHSGEVEVTIVGRVGDPAAIELRSDQVSQIYAGAGHADEETDGAVDIGLNIPATDPVMARLADTGDLSIVFPTRKIVLPNAFAEAHDFLNICRPRI